MRNLALAFTALSVCMSVVLCPSAHATLGGGLDSVESDRVQLKARTKAVVSTHGGYSVHEMTLPGGTLVRQYVSGSGTVFAVTWSGQFKPNLRQLLGAHFDTMVSTQTAAPKAGRSHLRIRSGDLVVESQGHLNLQYYGRAYLANELPAGLNLSNIE
ncbi:MAG: DUF2844 domain-containing protein [Nitrospinae bacterium]|nr:DUF2844 domain-containing protein [Nitrospinota bacterium]